MNYSAIDLHSNHRVVVVTDEADRVMLERRMPNDLAAILAVLAPYRDELAGVVVESTFNWYWLVDGLQEAGYRVHLANTTRRSSAMRGSSTAARKPTLPIWRTCCDWAFCRRRIVYPKEQRAMRDLARKRMQLVRSRTQHVLAVENIVARETAARIKSNDVKRLSVDGVVALGLRDDVTLAVQANVAVIETLNAQIDKLEKRLQDCVQPSPDYALLISAPGIGRILATTILLEVGMIERFKEVGHFASYARCVDSVRLSNGKKKGEGNVKNGNAYLAWAFVEAANFARRYCAEAKRFFDRKKMRTNNVVAPKALAHKRARACYHMLKEKQPFDVKRCFAR